MGIKGLTDLFKQLVLEAPSTEGLLRNVTLDEIGGSTVILDFSLIAFQYGNTIIKGDLPAMGSGCLIGFFRFIKGLLRRGIRPIVVFDQVSEELDAYAASNRCLDSIRADGVEAAKEVDVALVLQAKTETRLGRIRTREEAEAASGRSQFRVTNELVEVVEKACQILSIQTFRPLIEADWLLATVAKAESARNPTYIITDDTDLLIYDIGSAKLLRRFSLDGGGKHKGTAYQMVDPSVAWKLLSLTEFERRAYLAAILGCDYFDGVFRIGPKAVMHVLQMEPEFCRSKMIKRGYAASLANKATRGMLGDVIDSTVCSVRLRGPAWMKHLKEFVRHKLSPSCFDGMTIREANAIQMPYNIPFDYIDHFLSRAYDHPVTGEQYAQFKNAIKMLRLGPMVEEKHYLSAPLLVGGTAIDPSLGQAVKDHQREELARVLKEGFGCHTSVTLPVFHSLGIELLDIIKGGTADRIATSSLETERFREELWNECRRVATVLGDEIEKPADIPSLFAIMRDQRARVGKDTKINLELYDVADADPSAASLTGFLRSRPSGKGPIGNGESLPVNAEIPPVDGEMEAMIETFAEECAVVERAAYDASHFEAISSASEARRAASKE